MTQNDSRYRLMVAIIRIVIVFIAIMLIGKLTNSSAHGVGLSSGQSLLSC